MRILSAKEMDEVFGGQSSGSVTTTMPTVHVTAPRVSSGNYWSGWSDFGGGYSSYDEQSGGYSGASYYYTYYPAVQPSNLPYPNELKCKLAAAAAAAGAPAADSGWTFAIVNSWGYENAAHELMVKNTRSTPAGYAERRGLTQPTVYGGSPGKWTGGTTTIYAAGFEAMTSGFKSQPYYNDAGVLVTTGKTIGAVDAVTHAVMVSAHEARHQWQFEHPGQWLGSDAEADAEAYAIKVVEAYKAGHKGNCAHTP